MFAQPIHSRYHRLGGVGYPSWPHSDAMAGASRSSASRIETSLTVPFLIFGQVALEFPCTHLRDIVASLLPFRRDEMRRDVFAQRAGDDVVLFQFVQRFVEVVR